MEHRIGMKKPGRAGPPTGSFFKLFSCENIEQPQDTDSYTVGQLDPKRLIAEHHVHNTSAGFTDIQPEWNRQRLVQEDAAREAKNRNFAEARRHERARCDG